MDLSGRKSEIHGLHLHDGMLAIIVPVMSDALVALTCSWVIFQYDRMGSDTKAATQKIIQVFNWVNSVSLRACSEVMEGLVLVTAT